MTRFVMIFGLVALASLAPSVSPAQDFERIAKRDSFLSLVSNRALTRLGIRLQVTGDGRIKGRAFGRKVTGGWQWRSGYFCRDLFVGGDALGANCQMVQIRGDTIRFTSDRGQGIHADLRIR